MHQRNNFEIIPFVYLPVYLFCTQIYTYTEARSFKLRDAKTIFVPWTDFKNR